MLISRSTRMNCCQGLSKKQQQQMRVDLESSFFPFSCIVAVRFQDDHLSVPLLSTLKHAVEI